MPSGRRVSRLPLAAALLLALPLAACVPPGAEPPDPAQAAAAREAELNRQQAEVHRQLAQGLEEAGEVEAAVQDYRAAARLDRWAVKPGAKDLSGTPIGDLERICEQGGAEGDDPEAVEQACTAAINSGRLSTPRLAVMLGRRGVARLALEDTEGAMADFKTALKIDSSDPDVLVARGQALERAGNEKGALSDYSIALLRAPDRADLRFARARLRTAIGNHEGAAADYDRILSNPEAVAAHTEAYAERALAHCRMGRAEAAEIGWQVWIDTAPGGADALEDRLWARGYLRPPSGAGFGPAEQSALRAWTKAGCPDSG